MKLRADCLKARFTSEAELVKLRADCLKVRFTSEAGTCETLC